MKAPRTRFDRIPHHRVHIFTDTGYYTVGTNQYTKSKRNHIMMANYVKQKKNVVKWHDDWDDLL